MHAIFQGMGQALRNFSREFKDWELRGLLVFGAVIVAIGVAFYMSVEGWDFWQALYFCVTTLTTVGYGDLYPTTDFSRVFTTFYVLIGVGFILGFVNVVARQATRPLINRMARRSEKTTDQPPRD